MTTSLKLDPRSVLLGAMVAIVVTIGLSAMQPGLPRTPATAPIPQPLRITGMPAGRDMVLVQQGSPLTVPDGKVFVATGVGLSAVGSTGESDDLISIVCDGLTVLVVGISDAGVAGVLDQQNGAGTYRLPVGLTAVAGSEVSATTKNGAAVLFGYLEDA